MDITPGEESSGTHCWVMQSYAQRLEGAMKEGNWPLFRAGQQEVPGEYAMLAPWKVAALAATLVQASGLRAEAGDSEVWGTGGAGCLEGERESDERASLEVALRWGASPGAHSDGDVPLWLAPRGTCVGDLGEGWSARDCGQELTLRVLPQTTPEGVSSLLSAANRDS